jgi:HEAT repeat protein
LLLFLFNLFAIENLLDLYAAKTDAKVLEMETLKLAENAIPFLTEVLKNDKYPDENRWTAMFLLGRLMNTHASFFIAKFTRHSNPILRMASLKTLLALKDSRFSQEYAERLNDSAMIVRLQALDNITTLKLKACGPYVWNMIFSPLNYYVNEHGKMKRTEVIRRAIRAIGDLEYRDATKSMLEMMKNDNYRDIALDLDYALGKLTKANSPNDLDKKVSFWRDNSKSLAFY